MSNYLESPAAHESEGNDVKNRKDDMVTDISRGYDLESTDPPSEEQNFYMLLVA
jgi:hypothetical protein